MTPQETNPELHNPLGIDGIEFIEYATSQPQALGALLEQAGFALAGRHRSREVMRYRQGGMNVIVNADPRALPGGAAASNATTISAIALRVHDADQAYRRALARGAWPIATRAGAMELNIPGVHGAGDSILYFVDRAGDFSIYDVDFKPVAGLSTGSPAIPGLHFFGVVQAVGPGRLPEWIDFYRQLMDFRPLPEGRSFGVMPRGVLLESPCCGFFLQLVEPPEAGGGLQWDEQLLRIGLGTDDVPGAVSRLRERGIVFVDREGVQPSEKGALTRLYRGGVSFELVSSHLEARA